MGLATAAAVVTAGAAVKNTLDQKKAAKEAAKDQKVAAQDSIGFQTESRDLARADLAPFVESGTNALQQLMPTVNQTGVDEGLFNALNKRSLPAINEARAASGLLNSAGTVDQVSDRLFNNFLIAGPQLQSQKFNQLFNIANQGQSAAAGQANTAVSTGVNVGNTLQDIGRTNAQGRFDRVNAITSGLNTLSTIPGAFGFNFKGNA